MSSKIMVVPKWFGNDADAIRALSQIDEYYNRDSHLLFRSQYMVQGINKALQMFYRLKGILVATTFNNASTNYYHLKMMDKFHKVVKEQPLDEGGFFAAKLYRDLFKPPFDEVKSKSLVEDTNHFHGYPKVLETSDHCDGSVYATVSEQLELHKSTDHGITFVVLSANFKDDSAVDLIVKPLSKSDPLTLIKRSSEAGHIFKRPLFCEYGHPKLSDYKSPMEKIERIHMVDERNICMCIHYILALNDDSDNLEFQASDAGPFGGILKEKLPNKNEQVLFGTRLVRADVGGYIAGIDFIPDSKRL